MNQPGAIDAPQPEPTRFYGVKDNDVKVGDWYWVKYPNPDHGGRGVPCGDDHHEDLMCVAHVGSNYVGLTAYSGRYTSEDRIHFDQFLARCRPEPNWREVWQQRMQTAQQAIKDKTKELVDAGQSLCLLSSGQPEAAPATLLPAKVSLNPEQHKTDLVALRDRLPAVTKEIEALGEDFALAAKSLALPDLVKLQEVKQALGVIEDRIFTLELYCGILETVVKIADGAPAPANTPIVVRQQLLFMDEETVFDYQDGGMDFRDIAAFDAWVVKPENLSRILPEPRSLVGFRVRRNQKDYGEAKSIAQAWCHVQWADANKQTYLLLRNGDNVYRIASEVDFSPRLIPKEGEIGEAQFKEVSRDFTWNQEKRQHDYLTKETVVTPDSVQFDDKVKEVEKALKHYNRIVVLLQGLLDRSAVFAPHPRINLLDQAHMDQWLVLLRDEERGLPNNAVTFAEYQQQLNAALRKGCWVYVDSHYDERYKDGVTPDHAERRAPRRGWRAWGMPDLCQVDSVRRDGSAVLVSWPWGERSKPRRTRFIESPDRPGWGHYERDYTTDRLCHEWVPVKRVLNLSAYVLGDYKKFLCDRALQGAYLKWAQYLLTAEDWARARARGEPPEQDDKAQPRK